MPVNAGRIQLTFDVKEDFVLQSTVRQILTRAKSTVAESLLGR